MICILDCLERGLSGGGVRKQIALFWEVLLWKPSGTIVTGVEPKLLPCRPDWVDDGIPLVINRLIDSVPAYSIGIYRCEKFWFVLGWVRFCQFRSHSSSHYTWTSHNVTCWRHWILTALWQDFKTSLIHPTCLLEFLTYNMKFGVLMIIGSCLLFMRVQVSHLFTFSWSSVSVTVHGACWLMLFILLAVANDDMYLFIYLILIMLSLYISADFRFDTEYWMCFLILNHFFSDHRRSAAQMKMYFDGLMSKTHNSRALFQYPIRHLIVRSHKSLKCARSGVQIFVSL